MRHPDRACPIEKCTLFINLLTKVVQQVSLWDISDIRRTKILKKAIILAVITLTAGCDGTMTGVVRGDGTRIPFEYSQGMDRDFYSTTIDGENFTGQAIPAGASSGFGTVFTSDGMHNVFTTSYTGQFVALLLGDKGATMRCQMQYADTSGFTTAGGIGVCNHSDGRIVDITW